MAARVLQHMLRDAPRHGSPRQASPLDACVRLLPSPPPPPAWRRLAEAAASSGLDAVKAELLPARYILPEEGAQGCYLSRKPWVHALRDPELSSYLAAVFAAAADPEAWRSAGLWDGNEGFGSGGDAIDLGGSLLGSAATSWDGEEAGAADAAVDGSGGARSAALSGWGSSGGEDGADAASRDAAERLLGNRTGGRSSGASSSRSSDSGSSSSSSSSDEEDALLRRRSARLHRPGRRARVEAAAAEVAALGPAGDGAAGIIGVAEAVSRAAAAGSQRKESNSSSSGAEGGPIATTPLSPAMAPNRSGGFVPPTLSRHDLFHGHLFVSRSPPGGVGILFHASEYPQHCPERFPLHLGYCQGDSPMPYSRRAMDLRNILLFEGRLAVLDVGVGTALHDSLLHDGTRPLRTVYEEDYGTQLADVLYLPGPQQAAAEAAGRGGAHGRDTAVTYCFGRPPGCDGVFISY